ncbi:hypothetical protein MYX84_00765 [Acidobacteria bacterium AH-259-O06]|nr:hypothetical protein [Acidobacteria bacterium AH-259-O06]
MPNRLSMGLVLFGDLGLDSLGTSGMRLGSGVTINPETSSVAANSIEERSYTTGLTALSLASGDLVIVHPKTALASGLFMADYRVNAANALRIGWGNCSSGASIPSAVSFDIVAFRRFARSI